MESVKTVNHRSVQAAQLTRRYGRTVALDHADLEICAGITGLLGPNGAGKTTLLSIVATVASPDAGQLSVLGHDPRDAAGRLAIRRSLGYLPQELGYHRHFKVAAFLDYVAILKEITDTRRRYAEVARVLAVTALEGVAGRPIRTLSGGMRRRLGLAQALLGDPRLLVLDEPAAGLDPEQRLRFREMLSGLPADRVTVLSTHQVDDVIAICSSVVVLLAGQVRFTGPPAGCAGRGTSVACGRPRSERRSVLAVRRWLLAPHRPTAAVRRSSGPGDRRGRLPAPIRIDRPR